MKTILLVVLLSAGTVYFANAQQHWSLGPTVGFGHTWLSMEGDDLDTRFHPAYSIGAKVVYSIDPHWGVSADLLFSGEGGKFESGDMEWKYRSHYIRIPLQGIYFFGDLGNKCRPKVSLGPSFGFLAGGKAKHDAGSGTYQENDIKDIFKGFDFGLNAAAGLNLRLMRNTWLNTDIAYYHGFSDISESGNEIRNRSIRLNAGVAFGIGK